MDDIDVLVIGAGPTGLTLAAILARAGVRHRIVERAFAPSDKSRALVVHAKTMEILQKLGVEGDLIASGRRAMDAAVYINKEKAFETEVGDIGVDDTPYNFVLFVSQAETERVLTRALTDAGGTIERGIEAKSFEVDANGVTATLVHSTTNRAEKVRARWVVGCDGAHSAVRHAGDFKFAGERYLQDFVLADVIVDLHEKPALRLCFNDDGLVALFPLREENLVRIIATRAEPPTDDAGDPTLAEVQKLFDRFTPFDARLSDPRWLARFRLHHRQADKYRDERLFLAGDAAHIHSPAGGQGMNTGIQDAANLAWKLVLVAKHGARQELLDTYDEERHPVGAQLLETTDRLFSMNTMQNAVVISLRNFAMKHLAPLVVKTRTRGAAFRFLSQLDIAYPKSSIAIEHGSGLGGAIRAGSRAPDAPLDAQTIFAATRALTHHLLVFAGDDDSGNLETATRFADKATAAHPWLRVVPVPANATVARARYGIKAHGMALIRPDGYVGARSAAFDEALLESYKNRVLG